MSNTTEAYREATGESNEVYDELMLHLTPAEGIGWLEEVLEGTVTCCRLPKPAGISFYTIRSTGKSGRNF